MSPPANNTSWSVIVWISLVIAVVPALTAWQRAEPVDSFPYLLSAAAGAAAFAGVGALVRSRWPERLSRLLGPSSPARAGVWLAGPCWGVALGLWGNRLLDASPPVEHPVQLLGYTRAQKGPARVVVSSWRAPGERVELKTTTGAGQALSGLQVGAGAVVTVRSGAFGWAWIAEARAAERAR